MEKVPTLQTGHIFQTALHDCYNLVLKCISNPALIMVLERKKAHQEGGLPGIEKLIPDPVHCPICSRLGVLSKEPKVLQLPEVFEKERVSIFTHF